MPPKIVRPGGFLSLVAALLLGLAACDDDSPTDPMVVPEENVGFVTLRPEDNLEFVTLRVDAPPLATTDTSFWAVAGQFQQLIIRQQPEQPGEEGDQFLTFELRPETLFRRPDGTFFQPGDSIRIQVTIDTNRVLADFRPSGLEFNPDEQARLKIDYYHADSEFLVVEAELDLWRQERPGELWTRLGTVQVEDRDEIETKLLGFTRYALAIGR